MPSRRKLSFAACLAALLMLAGPPAQALFLHMGAQEREAASALIVVGTFIGETHVGLDAPQALRLGVIRVQRVLKGEPDRSVALVVLPPATGTRPSTDIQYKSGQHGTWYLRAYPDHPGLYLADHPERFVPSSE